MVLMLGLRRERLGRGGRCPRPVVRPVAFIGAIHLQGRISSTQPEESHPPRSTRDDDTKGSDTVGMIVSARALFDHSMRNLKSRPGSTTRARIVPLFGERRGGTVCWSARHATSKFESRLRKRTYGETSSRAFLSLLLQSSQSDYPQGKSRRLGPHQQGKMYD